MSNKIFFIPSWMSFRLYQISLISACVFGAAATLIPVSYVADLTIANEENFLTIKVLKKIKNNLPIIAAEAMQEGINPNLRDYLTNTVLNPRWVEKNIFATFSITKSDLKELVESGKTLEETSEVAWLNIHATSQDKLIASLATKWIAQLIYKESYKYFIISNIQIIRNESDKSLVDTYKNEIIINTKLSKIEENIKIVKNLNQKYPEKFMEQARFQLNSSATELDDLSYLAAYFSPSKQLAILEAKLAQTIDAKIRLGVEVSLSESKLEAANHELDVLESISFNHLFDGQKIVYEFWSKVNFNKLIVPSTNKYSGWVLDYIEKSKEDLRLRDLIAKARISRQISQAYPLVIEEKFSKSLIIMVSFIFGAIIPYILLYAISIFRRTVSGMAFGRER